MPYTPVPSKATGDPAYSAYDINTYIKANQAAGVPDIFTTKGDIAVATSEDVASRLGVSTNGYILKANSAQATGLQWAIQPAKDLVTTKGDILAATGPNALARVAAGGKNSALVTASGQSAGVQFSDSAGLAGLASAKGSLTPGSAADTAVNLAVGGNGSYLVAASGETSGLKWANNAAVGIYSSTTRVSDSWITLATWSETFDNQGLFATPYFTPAVTGYYFVSINWFTGGTTDNFTNVNDVLKFQLYDTTSAAVVTVLCELYTMAATGGAPYYSLSCSGSDIVRLVAGRNYELQGYTNLSAGGLETAVTTNASFVRLGSIGV